MGDDLRRRLIDKLRTVKHMLDCSSEHPGGVDGNHEVTLLATGETMTLVDLAQRLNAAYTNGDHEDAIRLLTAKL